jgi:tetratricopeptide (TPR) repeat protein
MREIRILKIVNYTCYGRAFATTDHSSWNRVLSQAQVRSAAAYYNGGNERFKNGDLDGAIADYDAALIFEPRLARAYNMRGSARYSKGDLDGSIAEYTRAIEIDPHLALAHYNRGRARRDKGDLDGYIADSQLFSDD